MKYLLVLLYLTILATNLHAYEASPNEKHAIQRIVFYRGSDYYENYFSQTWKEHFDNKIKSKEKEMHQNLANLKKSESSFKINEKKAITISDVKTEDNKNIIETAINDANDTINYLEIIQDVLVGTMVGDNSLTAAIIHIQDNSSFNALAPMFIQEQALKHVNSATIARLVAIVMNYFNTEDIYSIMSNKIDNITKRLTTLEEKKLKLEYDLVYEEVYNSEYNKIKEELAKKPPKNLQKAKDKALNNHKKDAKKLAKAMVSTTINYETAITDIAKSPKYKAKKDAIIKVYDDVETELNLTVKDRD